MALLKAKGWMFSRVKGDHWVYTKEGALRPLVIPGKQNDELAIGTLKSILRQAGLNESDFDGI